MCDAHDQLFLSSPRPPGEELRRVAAARDELVAFRAQGGESVVQWTPYGLGRAADLPPLSWETGVHVVAATGLHESVHYGEEILAGLRGRLAEVFLEELTAGIGASGVRAGPVKVAGGFHLLDARARWIITAAAEAHHATGAPAAVHLALGTGALDVLDLLCGKLRVPPHRVILGHLNRSPDLAAHRQAAESGCCLTFDGPSRAHPATAWRMPDAVRALAEAGFGDRLLLGGDTTTASAGPGPAYLLLRRVRRRLELLIDSPAAGLRRLPTGPARGPIVLISVPPNTFGLARYAEDGERQMMPRKGADMALEMRDRCERCETTALPADGPARICSYECTFCVPCGEAMRDVCPNCGGELVPRPRRAASPA